MNTFFSHSSNRIEITQKVSLQEKDTSRKRSPNKVGIINRYMTHKTHFHGIVLKKNLSPVPLKATRSLSLLQALLSKSNSHRPSSFSNEGLRMSFTHGGTFCGGGVDEGVGLDCGHRNIVSYPSGGVMPHGSVSGMTSLSTGKGQSRN
ncbi:hypothetical protein TNIN_215951 [Trichonephila inaurata madagascariensis]|uniref:Uncharacterized protein n=1 Tax=Trichonephila inaurata madagascariensis TaxID=2747483 RepID=A0A8X6Y590_9ARAC|nr:hypothetical protein TNIN_215951 [Trichonephila inaurata madagascariensis]